MPFPENFRVTCIGGGPAGLYFAILIKRRFPAWQIGVLERNRPLDTFGWGVVFSDATLENLRAADEPTHREITQAFAHWDDIEIHFDGRTIVSGGHGFSGISRKHLLEILQRRAAELGVELSFCTKSKTSRRCAPQCDLARRRRRDQQSCPKYLRKRFPARARPALMPFRLAWDDAAARCVHVFLRADRARLVYRARVSFRRRTEHVHR